MKLQGNTWVSFNKKSELWTNIRGQSELITDPQEIDWMQHLKHVYSSKRYSNVQRIAIFNQTKLNMLNNVSGEHVSQAILDEQAKAKLTNGLQRLMNFFTEFSFSPNFRFVNTLAHKLVDDRQAAIAYIANYFALTDNPAQIAIVDKMKSQEFSDICDDLASVTPTKTVNERFALYYGAQGTGKTTQAMVEANNNCMVCHSAMLPSDLMEDFKFENGQPNFTPSALQNAIVNGETIVLDEINLLPFESLRFLQSILDGKKVFTYKGQLIEITDGFKIIGTMNLQVNGMTYALPEPLVDRAADLRQFELTAEQLVGAII